MIFEPAGAGVTEAGPQAAMWPSRMTMTAFSSGRLPVPSMTRAPRRTTVLMDWACETNGRQNTAHRIRTIARIKTHSRRRGRCSLDTRALPFQLLLHGADIETLERLSGTHGDRGGCAGPLPAHRATHHAADGRVRNFVATD